MNSKQLRPILKLLREAGVTRYQQGDVVIELGPAPAAPAKVRVSAQKLPGADVSAMDVGQVNDSDNEITDPRQWLEAKYRAAGQ